MIEFNKIVARKQKQYRAQYLEKLQEIFSKCKEDLNHKKISNRNITDQLGDSGDRISKQFANIINILITKSNDLIGNSNQLVQFCKEFGIDKKNLFRYKTKQQKQEYIINSMRNQMYSSFRNITNKIQEKTNRNKQEKIKLFDWLNVKTKYQNLEQKVKNMLIQTINQIQNQQQINQFMQNQDHNKKLFIKLNQDSDFETENSYIHNWDELNQYNLNQKVKELKHQFSNKQFLKKCQRFKYISKEEYQTIAYDQIYRKLNQKHEKHMSRDYILKKYLSGQEQVTEKQVKYVLNTSPLMSKSVNKTLVNQTLKKLDHNILQSIELKIADSILKNFGKSLQQAKQARKKWKKERGAKIKQNMKKQQKQNMGKIIKRQIQMPYHHSNLLFSNESNEMNFDNKIPKRSSKLQTKAEKVQITETSKNFLRSYYSGGLNSFNNIKNLIKNECDPQSANQFFQNNNSKFFKKSNKSHINLYNQKAVSLHKNEVCSQQKKKMLLIQQKLEQKSQNNKKKIALKKLISSSIQNTFNNFKSQNYTFTPQQINIFDNFKNSPLYYAVRNKNLEFVTYLIKLGANPNQKCLNGDTPLHLAFKSDDLKLINQCLANSPNLNSLNDDGYTPLGFASRATLKKLGLLQGITKIENGKSIQFNNNKLLCKKESNEIHDDFLINYKNNF